MAASEQKEMQPKPQNRNGKKNNYMDTSSNKLARLHARILGYGNEKETFGEKLNIF